MKCITRSSDSASVSSFFTIEKFRRIEGWNAFLTSAECVNITPTPANSTKNSQCLQPSSKSSVSHTDVEQVHHDVTRPIHLYNRTMLWFSPEDELAKVPPLIEKSSTDLD